MRLVDLISPVGKGSRQLIVSPPKAGKTVLLEQMSHAILYDSPRTRIIVLLIDERPEEVTHFRRSCEGVVVASTATTADSIAVASYWPTCRRIGMRPEWSDDR
jgi:transcription termination factor Rho